jgi:tripartite-type tricarboxylate transporter receptor subunit TctC
MRLPRRRFLALAAAAALPAAPRIVSTARAQTYPARPVRLIEGFGAGSATDLSGRLLGQWLSMRLGQPFVVENRTGAGSNVAAETVVRAPADGYTLLIASTTNAVNTTLYDKLNFNFIRDIAPVAGLVRLPIVLVVNPSLPARTFPEFIAYAKANPEKISLATPGNGTPMHVASELLRMTTGARLVHVPYRTAPAAYPDLLSGGVQAAFVTLPTALPYVRAGTLRALALAGATRSQVLPDVPTVAEFVPGFEASAWQGIGAPKATPTEIVEALNAAINAGLADPAVKSRYADLGAVPTPLTPAEFGSLIATETEKWAKVVRTANIKPE